jgi:hypothetical protein
VRRGSADRVPQRSALRAAASSTRSPHERGRDDRTRKPESDSAVFGPVRVAVVTGTEVFPVWPVMPARLSRWVDDCRRGCRLWRGHLTRKDGRSGYRGQLPLPPASHLRYIPRT